MTAATTHVRLVCRPAGYAVSEADEPPPAPGDLLGEQGQLFVVDGLVPSPFPADRRRCAVLVAAVGSAATDLAD